MSVMYFTCSVITATSLVQTVRWAVGIYWLSKEFPCYWTWYIVTLFLNMKHLTLSFPWTVKLQYLLHF